MSDPNSTIDSTNLVEFFRERILEAIHRQKVKAPQSVEFYLVNLLKEYLKVDGLREEPLAIIFSRAVHAKAAERIEILRKLGDFSLYISGFFPTSLNRQLIDIDYYVQMGESAYGSLSQILAHNAAFSEIYSELANRFISYADILSEVSENSSFSKDTDLLRLYEMWLKTGSDRAKAKLIQEGIQPIRSTSLIAQ